MPHSICVSACAVYQAWCARWKAPAPIWTIRTGPGQPSAAGASGRAEARSRFGRHTRAPIRSSKPTSLPDPVQRLRRLRARSTDSRRYRRRQPTDSPRRTRSTGERRCPCAPAPKSAGPVGAPSERDAVDVRERCEDLVLALAVDGEVADDLGVGFGIRQPDRPPHIAQDRHGRHRADQTVRARPPLSRSSRPGCCRSRRCDRGRSRRSCAWRLRREPRR